MRPSGLSAACVLRPAQMGDLGTPGVPTSLRPSLPGCQAPGGSQAWGVSPGRTAALASPVLTWEPSSTLSKESSQKANVPALPGALGLWLLRVTCRCRERTACGPTGLSAQTWGAGTPRLGRHSCGSCCVPDLLVCVCVCVCMCGEHSGWERETRASHSRVPAPGTQGTLGSAQCPGWWCPKLPSGWPGQ